MQPFLVLPLLILILLTPFIEAQYYSRSGCRSKCGDVEIRYPFGIGKNCSVNEWYNVDCNFSRPYLSALNNVEVFSTHVSSVIVKMSVSSADCENPVHNSNLVLRTSHGKSPFLFSGAGNILVVKGCGSAAIMENGTIVTGCSTTCGSDTVSNLSNCFGVGCCQTTIPHDLDSFTFNLTGLERKEYGNETSCGSAFVVDKYYTEIFFVNHNTLVPITLTWNDSSTGCNHMCGEVLIPFPFGIGKFCSKNKWFNVDCNSSIPYLPALNNVEVLGVNESREMVTLNWTKISYCKNSIQNNYNLLLGSPFFLEGANNIFVVEGCGNAAIMDKNGNIVAGCSTTCQNDTVSDLNNCFGIGCCQTTITYEISKSFTLNLTGLERKAGNGTCSGSAFLVDRNSFIQGISSREFIL